MSLNQLVIISMYCIWYF